MSPVLAFASSARPLPSATAFKTGIHNVKAGSNSRARVVMRAEDDDADFEARIANLRKAKGAVPYGESRTTAKMAAMMGASTTEAAAPKKVDYTKEVLWREFAPARADLAFNVAMATTLVWIPLTAAAVGRCAFVKYRITDKRISVKTDAPWKKEESDIGFHEVANVAGVSRGFGLWGDMVITLSDKSKLELRSVPQWQEVRDYVLERRDAVRGKDLSQDELLNGPTKAKGKGFA